MSGQPNLVAIKTTNNTYSLDVLSLLLYLEGEIKGFVFFFPYFFIWCSS